MPPTAETAGPSTEPSAAEGSTGYQLPWAAIPKFIPGTTDVTEYSRKLEFLAAMWPKEHLSLLAPRAALQVEGTASKKIANLPPAKLKSNDESGIKLLVSTLGGSWGKTDLEAKYDVFEKALYGTVQKQDETNDSYLARHDVHFEELLSKGVTFEQVRAYILLRQSQLTAEDRKKIILELGGSLDYKRVCSSIRLLGSRFFADLQGQRASKFRTYDANVAEDPPSEEGERTLPVLTASAAVEEGEADLDDSFIEAMVASEDQDALQVQAFEEELENFFQDTPELQEALVSYLEARSRLLAKKKSRGFWPVGGGKGASKGGRGFKGNGKGKGKHREQLLARIARSNCRLCGEKGHWKAECPRRKGNPSSEATTTVAEAFVDVSSLAPIADQVANQEILTSLPADALTLEEALCASTPMSDRRVASNLRAFVQNLQNRCPQPKFRALRLRNTGEPASTEAFCSDQKRVRFPEPEIAVLAQQPSSVEAILDTGASRCVMGKGLLQTFVGQLSESVRSRVRVQKSAIRFRFGNNQTLLSDRRILLPFRTTDHQVLWLGIEVVPGRTPLLFSKKAIKQLGGIINTVTDVCELRRLQRSIRMQTGPTGLYMIDLSRLCEENNLEAMQPSESEDQPQEPAAVDPCMFSEPMDLGKKTSGCIVTSPRAFRNPWVMNLRNPLKHSGASAVNDSQPGSEQVPGKSTSIKAQVRVQQTVASAATPALNRATSVPTPAFSTVRSEPHHGPEQQCIRDACPSRSEDQLGSSPSQASGSCLEPQHDRDRGSQPREARCLSRRFWNQDERSELLGMRRRSCRLDEVVRGTLPRQLKAQLSDFPLLRGKICEPSRAARGRYVRRASRDDGRQGPQGVAISQGNSEGPQQARWSRDSLGTAGGANDSRSSGNLEWPHVPDGTSDARDDSSHSSIESTPELLLSEVLQCQRELGALVSQHSSVCLDCEASAKLLMQSQPTLPELRAFLKKVPWHLFADAGFP